MKKLITIAALGGFALLAACQPAAAPIPEPTNNGQPCPECDGPNDVVYCKDELGNKVGLGRKWLAVNPQVTCDPWTEG